MNVFLHSGHTHEFLRAYMMVAGPLTTVSALSEHHCQFSKELDEIA